VYEAHIARSLELADALIIHSDELVGECEDDRLLALDGAIRDCGMRIRRMTLELMVEKDGPAGPEAEQAKRAS